MDNKIRENKIKEKKQIFSYEVQKIKLQEMVE